MQLALLALCNHRFQTFPVAMFSNVWGVIGHLRGRSGVDVGFNTLPLATRLALGLAPAWPMGAHARGGVSARTGPARPAGVRRCIVRRRSAVGVLCHPLFVRSFVRSGHTRPELAREGARSLGKVLA
jgi:hypothetical protein